MKRQITFAILLISSFGAFAQGVTKEDLDKEIKPLTQKVNSLQSENSKLKSEIGTLNSKLSNAYKSIDSLRTKSQDNSNAITQTANQLGIQIKETGDKNEGKITEVQYSLSKNSLYGIIGVLSAILLSGLLYWLLSKRQQSNKTEVEGQLLQTNKIIKDKQEETYKSLNQLNENISEQNLKHSEVIEKILEISGKLNTGNTGNEINHEFPLKVADEITLLERNVNLMDPKTKGHKQLLATVRKLKDNLSAQGYDMPDLLGKNYHPGLNVLMTANVPDENLDKGIEIISKIVKPLVNYNGVMIQSGQVEISVGF